MCYTLDWIEFHDSEIPILSVQAERCLLCLSELKFTVFVLFFCLQTC